MFEVQKVAPIGSRQALAFVTRENSCGMEEITQHVYPEDARCRGAALRALRLRLMLSFRQLADALGLSVVQASGLEAGSYMFVEPTDWRKAHLALKKLATQRVR